MSFCLGAKSSAVNSPSRPWKAINGQGKINKALGLEKCKVQLAMDNKFLVRLVTFEDLMPVYYWLTEWLLI